MLSQKHLIEKIRTECGMAVSSRTVNAWVAAGMPYAKLQRRKVFFWAAVLAWLQNQTEDDAVRDSLFRRKMRAAG